MGEKLEIFEVMYSYLWEFIYKVLAIFGYEVVDGDIVKKDAE